MKLLDKECGIIYSSDVSQENKSEIVLALWEMVESEISKKFEEKKKRNKEKNKPSRFDYFKLSLPVMQEAKQLIFNHFDITDVKTDTYQTSKNNTKLMFSSVHIEMLSVMEELRILAEDSKVLLNAVLRMKAEDTQLMSDPGDTESPVLSLRLAHISQENSAIVEILSLAKVIEDTIVTF